LETGRLERFDILQRPGKERFFQVDITVMGPNQADL
jgi:hypothetical protein